MNRSPLAGFDPLGDIFETRELKTTKSSKAIQTAIRETLVNDIPQFKLTRDDSPKLGIFAFDAEQETHIDKEGKRRCVIMVGQTKDDETKILFKILEYETDGVNYVPINPKATMSYYQKVQVNGGIHFITDRLQKAIGQP